MTPVAWLLLLVPFLMGKSRAHVAAAAPGDRSPRSDDDAIEMKNAAIAAALKMDAGVGGAPSEPWIWFTLPSGKRVRLVIRNGQAQLPDEMLKGR